MDERVAERTFSVLTDADEIDEAEKALLGVFDAASTWTRLGQAMPDYDRRKQELRRLGPRLEW